MRRYQLIPSHAVQTLLITSVSPLPSGEIGAPYSFTFNAIGGVAPYTWSEVGSIPSGLTFSGGTLSGTPSATFSSSFNVTVTDSVGSQFTRAFSLTVITAVQITTASPLPGGTVGMAYSTTIAATGGATPYSWSILGFTGANSYSINSVTGVLTGTLGVAEIDSINIQVVDALGIPSAKNFNLTVIPAASLTITTTSPLPAATQSSAYSTTMAATGGTPPYTWSLTSHTGTNTWSVSSSGVVTGTPANLETDSLVIKVTDSVANTASGTFSLTVNPASGIVFDFFIAPNGDDNNAGTLASPWSLTALNSKQATYAPRTGGKKIGIIGDISGVQTPLTHGTIGGVQTLLFTIINANANQPALAIDGGTAGASVYVASCNSAGVYTPRWAQIDARNGSSFNTNTSGVIMGQSADSTTQVPHPGWLTIDGLTIQGFSNSAITLYYTARTSGLIIQNCEIFNGSCSTSGNNPGAIKYSTTSGLVITNNKIHDLVITGAGGSPRWGLLPITGIGNSTGGTDGTVITNNTSYNCSGYLQKDGNTDFANCSYNYIDHGIFGSAANSDTGIAQGSLISQQPSAGVTSVFHHNICLGMMWLQPQGTTQFRGTMQFFNNTFYGTPAYGAFWVMDCRFGLSGSTIQFFNNLIAATNGFAGGSGAGSLFVEIATVTIANLTFNNNVYMNGMTFGTVNDVTLPSFAQWKTNTGCDASSVVLGAGVNPFTGTPTAQTPSTFATNANAVIGSTTCGALDGSGSVGCNF